MRHLLSILVIAFSVSALLGGYLGGRAAVPQFAPQPHSTTPTAIPSVLTAAPLTDEVAHDEFASDDAVVAAQTGDDVRQDARIALVVVDAGESVALESPFLTLNVPVTLVLDPSAAAAPPMFRLAREHRDAVYVQMHAPLTSPEVRAVQHAFPGSAGIAMRLADGADPGDIEALRAAKLAFFDEYGADADAPRRFAAAGVRYVARGITLDDHAQRSYVAYMLAQAVHLARSRTLVVMARPFPGTLQAFKDLLAGASREGVHVVGVP